MKIRPRVLGSEPIYGAIYAIKFSVIVTDFMFTIYSHLTPLYCFIIYYYVVCYVIYYFLEFDFLTNVAEGLLPELYLAVIPEPSFQSCCLLFSDVSW